MKSAPPELKSWLELAEKALMVVSISIGIITAAYKGSEFLDAKSNEVKASQIQTEKRTEAISLMTSTYTSLLNQLNDEIKALDEKMGEEIWEDSVGWRKFKAIREAKVQDRNALLQSLGGQIVKLKEAES